jgi:hypothetical protein
MAAPNVVNVSSIYGKTMGAALGTSANTQILPCPSDKILKINSIIVSNVDGANSAAVTVKFYDSAGTNAPASWHIAKAVSVPATSTLIVLGKDAPIYLEEGDEIRAGANNASDLEIIISYEELDDA